MDLRRSWLGGGGSVPSARFHQTPRSRLHFQLRGAHDICAFEREISLSVRAQGPRL